RLRRRGREYARPSPRAPGRDARGSQRPWPGRCPRHRCGAASRGALPRARRSAGSVRRAPRGYGTSPRDGSAARTLTKPAAPAALDAEQLPAPAHLVAEERDRPHERVEEVLRGDEPEPAQRFVLAEEPEHADEPRETAAERPHEGRPAQQAPAGHEERQAAPE